MSSQKRARKRRYNQKLEYIAAFEKWLSKEPPRIFFRKWIRWKRERPITCDQCGATFKGGVRV